MTDWLQIASDSFEASTSYVDDNWRKAWERNISLFQSRHPAGSKYNSEAYKKRSRLFRPKTKSVVRKNEAAAAAAFFANVDVVSVEPENDADPIQFAAAKLMNGVLNYRLTKTVPWFQVLIGAIQEAQVIGIVASYQYWKYAEKTVKKYEPLTDDAGLVLTDAEGRQYMQETEESEAECDEPCIELIPVENIRFDPGANWTDVVGSSPYLIRMVPMYLDDVRQMMSKVDNKTGQPKWNKLEDGDIRTAMVDYDSIRSQREKPRSDPKADNNAPIKDFEIVWCHENFVRINGEEMVYWTLGTQHLLTDPKPLEEVYFTGKRPVVIGYTVLEAHKAVPDSLVAIGAELQREANETINSRRDNVALVLNKRYIVKRNAQVDVDSLLRNVAGSVTMANSVDDVQEMNWPDVTSSAYQEQDRLNVDFDELTGNFSQSSVQTNRALNETVGGMNLMSGGASQMTEYLIRTFVETWVEPVLKQLVELEKEYETDDHLLEVVAQKVGVFQARQIVQAWDQIDLDVRVNVGMGSTNPQGKIAKFMGAVQTYATAMQALPDADPEAVRREVFGLAGYKDGSRFFKQEDNPVNQQLKMQMQQLQHALQQMQQQLAQAQQKAAVQAVQLANKEREIQVSAQDLRIKAFDAETKRMAATKTDPVAPQAGPSELDVESERTKRMAVEAEAEYKKAQQDLIRAQTVKTLVDAEVARAPASEGQAPQDSSMPNPTLLMAQILDRMQQQQNLRRIVTGPSGQQYVIEPGQ